MPLKLFCTQYTGCLQAYEGLKTAERLKENYLFIPEKVKEVYLAHLLGQLEGFKVSALCTSLSPGAVSPLHCDAHMPKGCQHKPPKGSLRCRVHNVDQAWTCSLASVAFLLLVKAMHTLGPGAVALHSYEFLVISPWSERSKCPNCALCVFAKAMYELTHGLLLLLRIAMVLSSFRCGARLSSARLVKAATYSTKFWRSLALHAPLCIQVIRLETLLAVPFFFNSHHS